MIDIYGDLISGNCLKVKYTADYLGINYRWHDVDILEGGAKTKEFLELNPQGQVPTIKLEDGRTISQSNAIVRYLARDSKLLPADAYQQAKIDEWLFWEHYSHEPYVAVCRFQMHYLKKPASEREAWRVERAEAALDSLEQALGQTDYLVGDSLSIADISLLAYTRLCHEGGFTLESRPAVAAWTSRCEQELSIETAG